jgi:hypothetical protein
VLAKLDAERVGRLLVRPLRMTKAEDRLAG